MSAWEEWARLHVLDTPREPVRWADYDLPPRTCPCGREFSPHRRNHVWCGHACRSRYAMRRMRARNA